MATTRCKRRSPFVARHRGTSRVSCCNKPLGHLERRLPRRWPQPVGDRWKSGGPWQKKPHAHSATATVTVRSPACTGRVDVKVGSVFTVICPDCAKWRQTLNRNSNRAKEKKRKMADDPVFRAKSEAAPTDPSSHMRDCDRTVEQRLEKQGKIAEQRYEKVLQVKDAQIADLKKLLAKEKTDAVVIRDAKHCESDGSLSA